jgi:hypothetical protein
VTTSGRTIESFEVQQQQANEHHRRRLAEGGPVTKPPDLAPPKLKAAARGRFAQILWSARFPHGQKATPRVRVVESIIRCDVELRGEPDAKGGTDWAAYTTKVDRLPAGNYRIIAPLGDAILQVPETFVP